jgi:adenine-specific DNA-methyltransferase
LTPAQQHGYSRSCFFSEIRSSGPEEIACWFLDTDYNGESFFVRHAYFLCGQEPYEKLKRALRTAIDEAEWSKLYSARSVPFDPPKKGKIAITKS